MVIQKDNKLSKFISKVYLWMFVGLIISAITSYYTAKNAFMLKFVYGNFIWILLAELLVVFIFSFLRKKTSYLGAIIMFLIYSITSGLTLSSIFIVYDIKSVGVVFLSSALMFGLLALYGYATKTDLSRIGRLLFFGLIAVIVMSIINMFVLNAKFDVFISIISVVVFLGLTAWDMQMIKRTYDYYSDNEKELMKASIYAALDLYLDFINIFLRLLNLFGNQKEN